MTMADTKISALTALAALAATDELVAVDKSDTTMGASGTNKRVTVETMGLLTGWIPLGETLAYGAADDPVYTAICSGVDLTGVLSVGMRLRVSQSTGGTKYFIITGIAFSTDTTLTLFGGTGGSSYDLINETISSPYYSMAAHPFGFPYDDNIWKIEITDTGNRATYGTTQNTVYNPNSLGLTLKPGAWWLEFQAAFRITRATAGSLVAYMGLSTANNSFSDGELKAFMQNYNANTQLANQVSRRKRVAVGSSTPYYLVMSTDQTSISAMEVRGDLATTVLRAVSAYL